MAKSSDDDQETNMAEVVNISGEIMRFELDGQRFKLKPGETASVLKQHVVMRRTAPDRDPVQSTIALLTNNKVVAIDDPRARGKVAVQART
jgi:hypothetical protein